MADKCVEKTVVKSLASGVVQLAILGVLIHKETQL